MLHASTQKLIIKLCELTEASEIAWKEGPHGTSVFESEGYVVEVSGSPPTLRLLCTDGRELERADESDLAAQPWPGGDGTFAAHVVTLAARASRLARGAEIAISRILSSLSAPPRKAVVEPSAPDAPASEAGGREADTAIERVLAVQPTGASQPEPAPATPVEAAVITAPEPAEVIEPEPEAPVEAPEVTASEPAETIEPEPEAPLVVEAGARVIIAETLPAPDANEPAADAPEPDPLPVVAAVEAEPEASPIVQTPELAERRPAFGETASFARKAAPVEPPKVSPAPIFPGHNSASRPVRAEPQPQPVPIPAAKPVPAIPAAQERIPEPAGAGPDVYKPWS